MVKIFVGGFPLDITELDLVKMVSLYGTVSTIKIVRDKKTGHCKGYAFLEMTDQAGAENAINELNGTLMGDRELSLNLVEEKPVAPKPFVRRPSYGAARKPDSAEAARVKRPRRPI